MGGYSMGPWGERERAHLVAIHEKPCFVDVVRVVWITISKLQALHPGQHVSVHRRPLAI